ncbi:MAG TPA: hypothetical protein VFT69_17115 [Pseudolabrys sp.]|nr:hypothetical protein [Pseudolabrys sp.]
MKFTNVSHGPRGLNTKTGLVVVAPGQSADVDMVKVEEDAAVASGWFVKGDAPAQKPGDNIKELQAQLAARDQTIADLNKGISDRDTEITDLKAKLEAATKANDVPAGVYVVTDKGRGWFAITQDGKEVTKSLREDDVKGFDEMSDTDKAAFVDLHKAEAA